MTWTYAESIWLSYAATHPTGVSSKSERILVVLVLCRAGRMGDDGGACASLCTGIMEAQL
jgi:hypothetical protein